MSSGLVNPIDYPEIWQAVVIGTQVSPGVCSLSGFKRTHKWDVKKGKGTKGATITYVGQEPAKGTITFRLWERAHFTEWDSFRPLLKYDPTKKGVQAVDIYHPSLADIDLSSVVTENVGALEDAGDGEYTVTVDFLEYFPPPKASAVSTPTGSIANKTTSPGEPPDPIADAQQKEIAALLKQATAP